MLERHLEKLLSFHAAATERSLVKAASRVGMSQPAVGKNIKFLEELLGTPLFVRHRRGVTLTPAGEKLQLFCESFLLQVRDVEQRVRSGSAVAGRLRIGTYESLGESFWPRALDQLRRRFPELQLELVTSRDVDIWTKLDEGSIDLIVDAEPRSSEAFVSYVLYRDSFGLYARPNFTYESRLPLSFVKLATDRAGRTIDSHLRSLDLPYELQYEVESFTFSRSLASAGLCAAILPTTLAESIGHLRPLPVRGRKLRFGEHRICVTTRIADAQTERLRQVVATLRKTFRPTAD